MDVNIALIGSGEIRDKILYYGLLYNIYKENQRITYHVWGEPIDHKAICVDFDMMTDDSVIYHGVEYKDDIDLLKKNNRIIFVDDGDLQSIDVSGISADKVHLLEQSEDEPLDEDNELAMALNYQYECLYGAEVFNAPDKDARMRICWDRLGEFAKESNVAAVDYHMIRKLILKHVKAQSGDFNETVFKDQLCRLEHIKWSRLYFMNGWRFGEPENGRPKDSSQKIHRSLVPYDELDPDEKRKDLEVIELMFALSPLD